MPTVSFLLFSFSSIWCDIYEVLVLYLPRRVMYNPYDTALVTRLRNELRHGKWCMFKIGGRNCFARGALLNGRTGHAQNIYLVK